MKKLIALGVLFCPSIAFAQATTGPMSTLFGDVIEIVGYTLGLVLMALLTYLAKWVAAKFKTQVPETWMSSVNVWLDKAIAYAEEWARNKVKTNETINSSEKLNVAVTFLLTMVDDKKLVAMSKEQIRTLIEARLAETRFVSMSIEQTSSTSETGASKMEEKKVIVESSPRAPEGGFVRLHIVAPIAILGLLCVGCGWWSSGGSTDTRNAILDCTTKHAKGLTDEFGKLYELAIVKATGGDGKVNWDSVKDTTRNFAVGSGTCVANNVIASLLSRVNDPSGPQIEGLQIDDDSLKQGIVLSKGDAKTVKTLHGSF